MFSYKAAAVFKGGAGGEEQGKLRMRILIQELRGCFPRWICGMSSPVGEQRIPSSSESQTQDLGGRRAEPSAHPQEQLWHWGFCCWNEGDSG